MIFSYRTKYRWIGRILLLPPLLINGIGFLLYENLSNRLLRLQEKHIHLSSLMQTEKQNSQLISKYKNADPDFLESLDISVAEKDRVSFPRYKESSLILSKTLCIEPNTIRNFLQRVEGSSTEQTNTPPHLLIKDFSFKKKEGEENSFYLFDCRMLKREYL